MKHEKLPNDYFMAVKLRKLEKVFEKYGIKGGHCISVGDDINVTIKDEIDVLEDKLNLLAEYQKFGSLLDVAKLFQMRRKDKC